jgi:sugar phosphate isomerase/epimerase
MSGHGQKAAGGGCASLNRRTWLRITGVSLAGLHSTAACAKAAGSSLARPHQAEPTFARKATEFQIACMTLPYARFPLARALTGIKAAGYRYVAWGTTHQAAGGDRVPVVAPDAPPDRAKELGRKCRDMGLEPLLMFSEVYPEAENALKILSARIKQAAAGGVPHVLTFGHTRSGNRKLWVERFKQLGPMARDHGVLIVVKQHGGETGTGAACAEIIREVADEGVKVNYDAGNVMDYLNVDPIPDLKACADEVRSFCIKDHRNFPKDQDCGPGFGEIDHYKLLHLVAFAGRPMPLCCENISAPLLAPPAEPEGVDALARRAREFLEVVTRGLLAG